MGIGDIFKTGQFKAEIESLKQENFRLQSELDHAQSLFTPEMQNAQSLHNLINKLNSDKSVLESNLEELARDISLHKLNIEKLDSEIKNRENQIVDLDDEILVQEFGLYRPHYNFANALDYKDRLAEIRAKQKALIKSKTAVSGDTNWQVNGSSSQGKKMVNDTQKLLLRAFNTECDELIGKVKYTNYDASLNRIYKSAETISKLGVIMNISITPAYLNLKVEELRLSFEYQQKKQQEKENLEIIQREIDAMLRRKERISITALAKYAGVDRSYFYRNLQAKQMVEDAQLKQGECYNPKKAIFDRATEEVNKQLKRQMILYKRRIKELELQIELLEEENQRLKENR